MNGDPTEWWARYIVPLRDIVKTAGVLTYKNIYTVVIVGSGLRT
jgi:hypothetical protein